MADNLTTQSATPATVPATTVIATDDVGGVHFQKMKLDVGGDGASAILSTTNPLPTNEAQVGGTNVSAFPAGFARVSDEPTQLFYDPFDSALDTTNRWTTTSAGGGVTASSTGGVVTLGSGTTPAGYSYLTSKPTFTPTIPSWLGNSWAIQIEAPAGNNAARFWGMGLVSGVAPTSLMPLGSTGNGYGFELDSSGVLQAVVYSAGTRTVVASLASSQPTDGLYHRYIVYYRTDRIYWYIDGLGAAQLVATSNFVSPALQVLPMLALSVAGATPPAASRVISIAGLAMWDTGKNNQVISDGTFGWRKARVLETGHLSVQSGMSARSEVNLYAEAVAGAVAETAISLNKSVGLATVAAATSNGPTTGKVLRITALVLTVVTTATTVNSHRIRIRANAAGAATTTSPIQFSTRIGFNTATWPVGIVHNVVVPLPHGLEIPSGAQFMATIQSVAANGTVDLVVQAEEYTP